jgi:spore coat polysaccharide biosynthesis protein SpsF
VKVVAIVQARMGSRRLPGKVLLDLSGQRVLGRVVQRLAGARLVREVIVATTTAAGDDPVEAFSRANGWGVFRGDETDVLARFAGAAEAAAADVIVRVTADCPCVDPGIVDRVLALQSTEFADYSANVHPRSFPQGLDVEAFTREALDTAAREAVRPEDREHVTPFIWSRPDRFRLANLAARGVESAPWIRITLDTPDDYLMLRALFDLLPEKFDTADVVRVVESHPWLLELNSGVFQKRVFVESDPVALARAQVIEAARWAARQDLLAAAAILIDAAGDPDRLVPAAASDASGVAQRLAEFPMPGG